MPKALDLTGKRFGSLIAKEKAPSRKKKSYWLCKCDCGVEKEIQTCHLVSGAIKSCGCQSTKFFKSIEETTIEYQCILCGKLFIKNTPNRCYCYDCSPAGISQAENLKCKKRALKHKLVIYKGGKCERCGYNKCEGALQFHHLNPQEKEFSLSHINLNSDNFNLEKIMAEVDKCILLCANCHSEEHYSEG